MGGRKDLITAGLTLGALADAKAKSKGKMSAIIATESGSAVSFTAADAAPVVDLTAAIVPVQSGSGDPYPPGGGKNKFDPSTAKIGKNWNGSAMAYSIASDYIPVTPGEYTFSISNTSKYSSLLCAFFDSEKTYTGNTSKEDMTVPSGVSYVILSIRCDSSNSWTQSDLDNAKIQFESGSSATPYAPYSNICPITGWDGVNVTRTGKNLINVPDQTNVTVSSINSTYNQVLNKLRFKANTVYTFSCDFSSSDTTHTWGIRVKYTGGTVEYLWIHNKTNNYHSVTTRANASIDLVTFAYDMQHTISVSNFQFEEGSTATAYEPYRGDTYTVTFGSAGTVYGGTLDVTTGTLTADKVMITKNTSTMDNSEDFPGWNNSGVKQIIGAGVNDRIIGAFSNISPRYASGGSGGIHANTLGSNDLVYLTKTHFGKSQSEWIAMAIDVQMIIPYATPIVYHLSPVEIRTLVGQNTIWADTGDVTAKYATTDTKAFIDKYIAARRNG